MTTDTQEPLALDAALQLVRDERKRQDDKWGSDRAMPNALWHLILSEEVGEVAEASLGHFDGRGVDADALRRELVQVAAVAVAWIEALDRPVARDEAAELKAQNAELVEALTDLRSAVETWVDAREVLKHDQEVARLYDDGPNPDYVQEGKKYLARAEAELKAALESVGEL